jgi:hypothetical protein
MSLCLSCDSYVCFLQREVARCKKQCNTTSILVLSIAYQSSALNGSGSLAGWTDAIRAFDHKYIQSEVSSQDRKSHILRQIEEEWKSTRVESTFAKAKGFLNWERHSMDQSHRSHIARRLSLELGTQVPSLQFQYVDKSVSNRRPQQT